MGYLEWDVRDLLAHGKRMSYRIPIGTEVFPYASESGEVGIGRLTTVEVAPEDTAQRADAAGSRSPSATSSSAYRSARTRWELEVDRAGLRAILNEEPAAIPYTKRRHLIRM